MIYDIFYVSKGIVYGKGWDDFRKQYPAAQKIDNVKTFDDIKSKAFTKLFYVVWDDTVVTDFDFSYRVSKWDEEYIHVWKTNRDGVATYQGGITLFPKNANISNREFDHKFYTHKKEVDQVVSKQIYPQYVATSYDEYKHIAETTGSPMFWLIWDNVVKIQDPIFDKYFEPSNGAYDYERNENHVFLNQCGDKTSFLNGIILCSKNKIFTKREFDKKYLVNKKENNIILSKFQYPKYTFNNYKEYLEVVETVDQPLFWSVPNDVEIINGDIFDLYFDPLDGKYDYDRNINHVFKNLDFYDGVSLLSKNKTISEQEFRYRFPVEKKEWDVAVSRPKNFDIVFISYNEPFADENFEKLKVRFPNAKRVHGVKGIHQAHIEAAKISNTELFWVVDADAEIVDTFNFEIPYIPHYDAGNRIELKSTVQVWWSRNPVNGLVYGYGGVKLFPKALTLKMNLESTDMTTSISKKFKVNSKVSNFTRFNTDPFNTWRSAFRECAKLASKVIDENYDEETDERLYVWCNEGEDKPFGKYAIAGAKAGKEFGEKYSGIDEILFRINNFEWLESQFKKWQEKNE